MYRFPDVPTSRRTDLPTHRPVPCTRADVRLTCTYLPVTRTYVSGTGTCKRYFYQIVVVHSFNAQYIYYPDTTRAVAIVPPATLLRALVQQGKVSAHSSSKRKTAYDIHCVQFRHHRAPRRRITGAFYVFQLCCTTER